MKRIKMKIMRNKFLLQIMMRKQAILSDQLECTGGTTLEAKFSMTKITKDGDLKITGNMC